jgi:adenylate cyclase
MWSLIVRYPGERPRRIALRPGVTTLGRMLVNDIVLTDTAVSRKHAEIEHRPHDGLILVRDLGSANGTFVNLERLKSGGERQIGLGDVVQIGATEIGLASREGEDSEQLTISLEEPAAPPDRPAVEPSERIALLYKVARQLNTVLDTGTALQAVSALMQEAMGADKCEVILASQFDELRERGFSITIASMAMERRAPILVPDAALIPGRPISESAGWLLIYSALCVPVLNGGNIIALIYLYKTDPEAPPFDEMDLSLAEAISHMVALTVERMNLFQRIHDEQRLRQLLQSQLAPASAEYLLHDYLKTGRLPSLGEEQATVLVTDIVDSTGWAERLGAELFGRVLRQYYHDLTDIVVDHGGMLNSYLGDGVLALFGITKDRTDSESSAIQAGLKILDYFEGRYQHNGRPMQMGVGINSGPVVAGYIDTKDRIEFAVLGDTVNVAFGLEALARPNRILIGPTTFQAVPGQQPTLAIGPVTIKRRAEPVQVFEVLRH